MERHVECSTKVDYFIEFVVMKSSAVGRFVVFTIAVLLAIHCLH